MLIMFASPFGLEVKAFSARAVIDHPAGQLGTFETQDSASMGMGLLPGNIIMPALMAIDAGRRWHGFHPFKFYRIIIDASFFAYYRCRRKTRAVWNG
jgi:hypothetical protein